MLLGTSDKKVPVLSSCWLTDPACCAFWFDSVWAQFGLRGALVCRCQRDFHTSASNHSWLPAELTLLSQRFCCIWNGFLNSCLITAKQKRKNTSARCYKASSEEKLEIITFNCMPLSFLTCFLWLVAKSKIRRFTSLQLVDKPRQVSKCGKRVFRPCEGNTRKHRRKNILQHIYQLRLCQVIQ